jgi:hypothetical protein
MVIIEQRVESPLDKMRPPIHISEDIRMRYLLGEGYAVMPDSRTTPVSPLSRAMY